MVSHRKLMGDLRFKQVKCLVHLGEFEKSLEEVNSLLIQNSCNEKISLAGYYLKSKVLMLKKDFKGALINLNNA